MSDFIKQSDVADVMETLDRLESQARNAKFLTSLMVRDDKWKDQRPTVTVDFSLGDFLVFDRKRHPEWKD